MIDKLTDIVINKRIHKLLGLCQHMWYLQGDFTPKLPKFSVIPVIWKCKKCKREVFNKRDNLDFTSDWHAFGMLWQWVYNHERFADFIWGDHDGEDEDRCSTISLISPRALSEAICKFFKEQK